MPATPHLIGLDVGSTTVKAVAIDPATGAAVWSGYERHETRQLEKALEFLQRLEADLHVDREPCRIFVTGSGGQALAPLVGGAFVQEVTALSVAVERLHPDVHAVIELGGQDAKIIVFQDDPVSGHRKKIPSMNDKCAGGTGAVIDKINAKLRIPPDRLGDQGFAGIRRHPVAGKCGVFAETDINSLQKAGVPPDELMASLFEAIVLQNLTVLARGHTLRPAVLLLGGPNTFIRGLREAWQHHIPKLWAERGVAVPPGRTPEELIYAPDHAQYFSAIGAVIFGRDEDDETVGRYRGTAALERYLAVGRREARRASGTRGLSASPGELAAFRDRFAPKPFVPAVFRAGDVVQGLVGLDGGSTSTKAALLSPDGDVLCTAYQLSQGNPIRDTIEIVGRLRGQVEAQGARLDVLGVCTTGYAKDVLRDVLRADAAIVETVAHTESAVKYYGRPDVIVDVGGQDIKIIVLRDGRVKDFRLNTQCSAGNGYFLQATAEAFGVPLDEYAGRAFSAHSMPVFGYGCAVFLQTDIVNFQRQGWTANEILAGLAAVLPKNVFLYVAKMPHLSRLGTRFVLQGGTQRNLAVVKAEVDFIEAAFEGSGERPEIVVHEHCAESGAIGAAVEAQRLWRLGRKTTFIGLDAVAGIRYRTTRSEETRCHFCRNACLRTFIDIGEAEAEAAPAPEAQVPAAFRSAVPKAAGERRLIVATCEKGAAEDPDRLRAIRATLDAARRANPNLVDEAARSVWKMRSPAIVADPVPARAWTRAARARAEARRRRPQLRIGLPRALNLYIYAPFFGGYFESLGIPGEHLVYSDYTSDEMYRAGATRGAVDPCFPAKVALAHVHNLLAVKHAKRPLDYIFFPMFNTLHTPLTHLVGSYACPTVTVTPDMVRAAFTKEADLFAQLGVRYVNPMVDLADRAALGRQLFQAWGEALGLSEAENARAVDAGFRELAAFEAGLRQRGRAVLDQLERERRVGLVLLGRPYHHDPGLNHEVLDEFQTLGYPIFSQSTLPMDADLLERLFGDEVRAGLVPGPLAITDVWKNSYSAGTNHKVWAAKFTARHPNLVALELSSFKCGHDAPVYSVIESIIERSGTPYFSFKDVDENRPAGSIRIRVETIHYFLTRYVDDLRAGRRWSPEELERRLAEYETRLRA